MISPSPAALPSYSERSPPHAEREDNRSPGGRASWDASCQDPARLGGGGKYNAGRPILTTHGPRRAQMRPAQVRGPSRFGRVMWSTTSLFHCDSRPPECRHCRGDGHRAGERRVLAELVEGHGVRVVRSDGSVAWGQLSAGPGGRPGEVSGIERNGGPDARPFGCPRLGGRRGAVAVGRDCGRPAGRTPAERRQEARSGPSGGMTPAEWGQDAVASGGGVVAEADLFRHAFYA